VRVYKSQRPNESDSFELPSIPIKILSRFELFLEGARESLRVLESLKPTRQRTRVDLGGNVELSIRPNIKSGIMPKYY